MLTLNVAKFEANFLKYLDIVNSSTSISVTYQDKTLATIVPPENHYGQELIQTKVLRSNLLKHLEIARSGEVMLTLSNDRVLATITPPAIQKHQAREDLKAITA